MSAISLKSITGITSITTPAGVDNQLTLHTNNTTEAVKLDTAGNLHFHNHLNITGVSTASNFKTGTSNLHNTGLNVFDLDVDGHTNLDNVSIAGITTAQAFQATTGTFTGDVDIASTLCHSGDTDTKITFATNTIKFDTDTEERLRITSTGSVGIGTDNPAGKLEIDAASTTDMIMLDVAGTNFARIGHNSSSGVAVLDVRSEGHTRLLTNGNNERLRITSSGKVALGSNLNTNPSYELHLQGSASNGGLYAFGRNHYLANESNAYASLTLKKSTSSSDATDYLQLRDSSNGIKLTISGDGTLKILDSIVHEGDTNTKIRFPGEDTFSVETGGNERFRIASDGQNTIKSGAHDKGLDILPVGNSQETRLRIQGKNSSGTEHTFSFNAKQSANRMDISGTGPICFIGSQNATFVE